jgi:hypothetical protein
VIIPADLERDQRVVVEALAILVWDATRTDLVALLRARGLRGASGKVFSSSVLGIILEELVGLGIIRSAASPSLELPVRDAVVEELRREGTLEGWLDVLPLAFPLSRLSGSVAERLERWRVHADLRRGHTDISPRWTSATGRARLADLLLAPSGEGIDAFPPASRPRLLSCALTRAFARWLDVSPLLELARAHASAPQISVPLACVEMCRGELARAERCLEASAPSVERAEARALLALFRGDRAGAVAAFEGAAAAVRKRSPSSW